MLQDLLQPWRILERLAASTKPAVVVADPEILEHIRSLAVREGPLLLPVEAVLKRRYFTPLPGPYFIVTRQDEQDIKRILRQHLADQGLFPQIFGALNDLSATATTERVEPQRGGLEAAYEALRSQPAFAIICAPRCGSQHLARGLYNKGLGRPLEHLRAPIVEMLKARKGGRITGFDFSHWLSVLIHNGIENGVFGTKLISHFLRDASRLMSSDEWAVFKRFLSRVPVVYLLRRNKLMQALSRDRAKATRNYHLFDAEKRDEYLRNSRAWQYDFARISSEIHALHDEELYLNNLVREVAPLENIILSEYETLDIFHVSMEINRRLGANLLNREDKLETNVLRDDITYEYAFRFAKEYNSSYRSDDECTHVPHTTRLKTSELTLSAETDPTLLTALLRSEGKSIA